MTAASHGQLGFVEVDLALQKIDSQMTVDGESHSPQPPNGQVSDHSAGSIGHVDQHLIAF